MPTNAHTQPKRSSSPETAASKSASNRVKGRLRWKLKFHNQSLPPEYHHHHHHRLHYYMAKLQLNAKSRTHAFPMVARVPSSSSSSSSSSPSPSSPRRTRRRLGACSVDVPSTPTNGAGALSSTCHPPSSQQSTVRYRDLPYMGEMTLHNAIPRRGRKPKKADICHLIFKNYGTTVVDEPLNLCVRDLRLENGAAKNVVAGDGDGDGDARCLRDGRSMSRTPRQRRPAAATIVDSWSKSAASVPEKKSRLLGRQRGRKNRKSIEREKLEKTFEERGFLIQTQQLESAQGTTYCKFRQLRKFTRYLFRSWKHHLPGDVLDERERS